jgi:hypothetical protein
LAHDSLKEALELTKKGQKFPWGPKLKAYTVYTCWVLVTVRTALMSVRIPDESCTVYSTIYSWQYQL